MQVFHCQTMKIFFDFIQKQFFVADKLYKSILAQSFIERWAYLYNVPLDFECEMRKFCKR